METAKALRAKHAIVLSTSSPGIPDTTPIQIKWLGQTVSLIKQGQVQNVVTNLSFAIFNITMLKAVTLHTQTDLYGTHHCAGCGSV